MNYFVDLINSIGTQNQLTNLIYVILFVFVFWMYKETRSFFIENKRTHDVRLDKALEIYGEVESEIYKYFNNQSDVHIVSYKLGKAYPYLSSEVVNKILVWKKQGLGQNELLEDIQQELIAEIKKLKGTQYDSISNRLNKSLYDMGVFYYKSKVESFVKPLVFTTINLSILLFFIFFILKMFEVKQFSGQILIFTLIVDLIFYIALLDMTIFDVHLKKRFKHTILNWLLYVLFITVPIPLFVWGPWYRGIVILALIIVYLLYLAKWGMKEFRGNIDR